MQDAQHTVDMLYVLLLITITPTRCNNDLFWLSAIVSNYEKLDLQYTKMLKKMLLGSQAPLQQYYTWRAWHVASVAHPTVAIASATGAPAAQPPKIVMHSPAAADRGPDSGT